MAKSPTPTDPSITPEEYLKVFSNEQNAQVQAPANVPNFTQQAENYMKTVPKTPSTGQDINQLLAPYMKELTQLGPEYGAEMEYLKPYLSPEYGSQAEQAGAKAISPDVQSMDESLPENQQLGAAEQATEKAVEGEAAPGFGNLAAAGKEFEGTLPYTQLLQAVLGAGKNEILYNTQPNLSNINTKQWPSSLQEAYQFLAPAATGVNAGTGLPSPAAAAANANQQQANTSASLTGGGNG